MAATILPDTIYTILRGLGDRLSGVERMLISPFGPRLATTLPSDPVDGQTIVYSADSTSGVVWVFRFNESSSSIYKWEYIGGTNLLNYVSQSAVKVLSGTPFTPTELTGVDGPALTLPLAGDWDATASMSVQAQSAAATNQAQAHIFSGGVDQARSYGALPAQFYQHAFPVAVRLTGRPAAEVVRLGVAASVASYQVVAYEMTLQVAPVRVG